MKELLSSARHRAELEFIFSEPGKSVLREAKNILKGFLSFKKRLVWQVKVWVSLDVGKDLLFENLQARAMCHGSGVSVLKLAPISS